MPNDWSTDWNLEEKAGYQGRKSISSIVYSSSESYLTCYQKKRKSDNELEHRPTKQTRAVTAKVDFFYIFYHPTHGVYSPKWPQNPTGHQPVQMNSVEIYFHLHRANVWLQHIGLIVPSKRLSPHCRCVCRSELTRNFQICIKLHSKTSGQLTSTLTM